jgi:Asp-tRNA(Asn)/Glu-tRNA(Gln) amidotransferase A subunit family amidase
MLRAEQLVAAIRAGTVSAEAVVVSCADAIDERERDVRAFACLTVGAALQRARELADANLPLAGLPFAVKDVIDTAGIPTECGSPLFAGRVPETSASIVDRLTGLGGALVGKTVTAELAFAAPGPTRNPWDLSRTPGGSSMGSAAGVAARMTPLALGTQTNSSVIMPAALCGVVGFKPSAGSLATDGVMAFSPTLDQLGWFTATAGDAAFVAALLLDIGPAPPGAGRLAVLRTAEWAAASPSVRKRFEAVLADLRGAGFELVDEPAVPAALADARRIHRTIMAYEAVRALGAAVASRPQVVSDVLRRFLAEGELIDDDAYADALRARADLIDSCTDWLAGFDAVLTPAAPDEAPSAAGTGDARFCTAWTLIGAPAIVVPSGRGAAGLPVGLQLVAAPGADAALLGAARAVEPVVAGRAGR